VNEALPVVVTRRAATEIREAQSWWRANRPKAPKAIASELRRVFPLIAVEPGMGVVAESARLSGVRRVYLACVRYYLYYRATDAALEVLALWHSSRGDEPDL
jgi:plasmid stabilization system protein ParE